MQPLVSRAKSAWIGAAALRRPKVGVAVSAGRKCCWFAKTEGRCVMKRARVRVRIEIGERCLQLIVTACGWGEPSLALELRGELALSVSD